MIKIGKIFEFHAAHSLPNHLGNCKNLHGHCYRLLVEVSGDMKTEGPESGMIIDYGKLKEIVKDEVLDKYDHSYLNEYYKNPTAELMIESMANYLQARFHPIGLKLTKIKLWETSMSYAEWTLNE